MADKCRFRPRFLGLPTPLPTFGTGVQQKGGFDKVNTWFNSSVCMTSGPRGSDEPMVGNFQQLSLYLLGVSPNTSEETVFWKLSSLTVIAGADAS